MEVVKMNGSGGDQKRNQRRREERKAAKAAKTDGVLTGFARIAEDVKNKFVKLGNRKKISSFSVIGVPTKGDVPKYSGGMVGDAVVIFEGLFTMARNRPEIRQLLEITVNALRETDIKMEVDLEKLKAAGKISDKVLKALVKEGVMDLSQLAQKTRKEVLSYKTLGKISVDNLQNLLEERGLAFAV